MPEKKTDTAKKKAPAKKASAKKAKSLKVDAKVETKAPDKPYYEDEHFDWTNDSLWKDDPAAVEYWLIFKS